jgi:hypothetical protein
MEAAWWLSLGSDRSGILACPQSPAMLLTVLHFSMIRQFKTREWKLRQPKTQSSFANPAKAETLLKAVQDRWQNSQAGKVRRRLCSNRP